MHLYDIPTALALPDWLPKLIENLALGTTKSIYYEGSLKLMPMHDAYHPPTNRGNAPEDWRRSWEKLILERLPIG